MGLLTDGALTGNALGTLLIQAIRSVRRQNQQEVDALLTADTPGAIVSALYPAAVANTAFYIAKLQGGVTVVLVDGVTSVQNALAFYNGYTPPFSQGVQQSTLNSWCDAFATQIVGLLQSKGWWGATANIVVGGHSAGGPVACYVADRAKAAFSTFRVGYHAFGSPRASAIRPAIAAERTPGVRWFNHNDPIPLLPLRFTDAPWAVVVVGLPALVNAGLYVHWAGGWQLLPGTVGHAEELPVDAAVSPITNLATWLWNINQSDGTGHTVNDYITAMLAEQALLRIPNEPIGRPAPVETPFSLRHFEANRAEAMFANTIAHAEERQNATPVAIPPTQVWRARRFGRTWVVTLGDQIVAICGSRRAAQALAREMNDGFRRLQRTAVVDPVALKGQLDGYLAAASDPAGNFRPVMNTTF